MTESLSLLQLNQLIARLMTVPQTQNVWVTAELSDVSVRGGHCYMELLQKDDAGRQQAKARAVIWANNYVRIASDFQLATGRRFETGIKVMVRASASMHPVYGMSLVITAVNPEYTMGDLLRRRQEILARLKAEGVLELNRQLQLPDFPSRIAVISAPNAAGYGDFLKQLYGNQSHLRFVTRLFPATMQGNSAPQSIVAALEQIAFSDENWDCVALIRGGGATSDLQAFEDYDLASAIAQFPLPVLIGIGHERDVTVLDYIANKRLKTPTAVAEFLVSAGENCLGELQRLGAEILQTASDTISAAKEQISYFEGIVPIAPLNALNGASTRLTRALMSLNGVSARRIAPALERLRMQMENLEPLTAAALARAARTLDGRQQLVDALSPRSVLARGYSITRVGNRAVRSASELNEGEIIETVLPDGSVLSEIRTIVNQSSTEN